jgi:hypothetical protein
MNVSLSEVVAGGFDRYDGSIQFYQRINALLRPDFVVMDFGAGRGVNHIEDRSPIGAIWPTSRAR